MLPPAAFVFHADLLHHAPRSRIAFQVARMHTMQVQLGERIIKHRLGRLGGIPAVPIRFADPVPEFGATMVGFNPQPHAAAKAAASQPRRRELRGGSPGRSAWLAPVTRETLDQLSRAK